MAAPRKSAPRRRRGTALSKPASAARKNAFGLRVTFDVSDMYLLMTRLRRQATDIRPLLNKAHFEMAEFMQAAVLEVLQDKIQDRGREQRGGGLVDALAEENPGFIQTDESGFTFGFFEDLPGTVGLYARNLEKGTDVHLGTELHGFLRDGKLVAPSKDQRFDARMVQFARGERTRPWGPSKRSHGRDDDDEEYEGGEEERHVAIVTKPIPAYKYMEGGQQKWRRGFIAGKNWEESVMEVYNGYFEGAGATLIATFFAQYGTSPPGSSQFALRRQLGRKARQSESQWTSY